MSRVKLATSALNKMLEALRNKPLYVILLSRAVKNPAASFSRELETEAESYDSGGKILVPKAITTSGGYTFLTFQETFWDSLKGNVGGFAIYDKSDGEILFTQLFDDPCSVPGSRFKIRFGSGADAPFSFKTAN